MPSYSRSPGQPAPNDPYSLPTVTINKLPGPLPAGVPRIGPNGALFGSPVPPTPRPPQIPTPPRCDEYDFDVTSIDAAHAQLAKSRADFAAARQTRERAEQEYATAIVAVKQATPAVQRFVRSLQSGERPKTDGAGALAIVMRSAWELAVAEGELQEAKAQNGVTAAEKAVNGAIAEALRVHAEALVDKHEASGSFDSLAVIIGFADAVTACDPLNPLLRSASALPREPFGYSFAIGRATAVCARVDPDRVDIRSPKILRATERYTAQIRSLMLPTA